MSNRHLNKPLINPDDEFYTRYEDIEAELSNYADQFNGKWIYCPADDYTKSQFVAYFKDNFNKLGLKRLTATYYINQQVSMFDEELPSKPTRYDFDGVKEWTIKMEGDGDMLGEECRRIMEDSDIIVTNPPFSLAAKLLDLLLRINKDFITVSHKTALSDQRVIRPLYLQILGLGYNNLFKFEGLNGAVKTSGSIWLQNIKEIERPLLSLTESYDPERYPTYDNYDAIECKNLSDIPKDYYDKIGVPVTYLLRHNPKQFDFIGVLNDWHKSTKDGLVVGSPRIVSGKVAGKGAILNGMALFGRAVIKRRREAQCK